jgi:Tfp pilus assembly protein PilW
VTERLRRLRSRARSERGATLIELLTVMVILATVLAALTQAFVSASTAELTQNNRFQAQLNARLALDKVRREVHCASVLATTGSPDGTGVFANQMTETLPSQCSSSASITWCTVSVSSYRYKLYRKVGTSCDSTGTLMADYLTTANAFAFTAQSSTSLAKLSVNFPVNIKPLNGAGTFQTKGQYTLADDIYLRNSSRS